MKKMILILAAAMVLAIAACGSKEKQPQQPAVKLTSHEDSLMSVLDAARKSSQASTPAILNSKQMDSAVSASGNPTVQSTSEAKTTAKQAAKKNDSSADTTSTQINANDTAGTLDAAVKKNAALIVVDSGSAEDRRLDSLKQLSSEMGYQYQMLVANHTHRTLAEAAHQDPVKQRRLLIAIYAAKEKRREASQKADSARVERMRRQNMDVGDY